MYRVSKTGYPIFKFKNAKANIILTTYHKNVNDSSLSYTFQILDKFCHGNVWCLLEEIPIAEQDDGNIICKYSSRFIVLKDVMNVMPAYSDNYQVFENDRDLASHIHDVNEILTIFLGGGNSSCIAPVGKKFPESVGIEYDNAVEFTYPKDGSGMRWINVGKPIKEGKSN